MYDQYNFQIEDVKALAKTYRTLDVLYEQQRKIEYEIKVFHRQAQQLRANLGLNEVK